MNGDNPKFRSGLYAPLLFGVVLILAGFSQKLVSLMEKIAQDTFLSVSIIQLAVFLLPLAFYCRLAGVNYVSSLKFRYFAVNKISFCTTMFLLFFFSGMFLRYLGITFFSGAMTDTPNTVYTAVDGGKPILRFIVFIIMPALFEEVFFRGILLSEYEKYSSFSAVLMTSIMYAMIHTDLENFFYYFVTGVIFGVLTEVTQSILPALVLHFLSSVSYFYFDSSITDYIRQTGKSALLPFIIVSVILLLIVLMFSALEGIYRDKSYDESAQTRKELLRRAVEETSPASEPEKQSMLLQIKEVFVSPTFLATVAIFIILSAELF